MRVLEIYNEEIYPKNIIVSGTSRSGKTSLCKIWASTKGTDWLEEPNSLIIISFSLLMGENNITKGIDKEACEALWGHNLRECVNSIVLGREGLNFRPGDMSSVWEFKDVSEIMERLYVLKSRDDVVKYIARNDMIFVIDIPEMVTPLSKLSGERFNSSMLVMVRDPSQVATDVRNKGWYADNNLTNPLRGNNYSYKYIYNDTIYRLPFWLEEQDAEEFIKSSDFVRGLIYWLSIAEDILENKYKINEIIRYEDLVKNPMDIVEMLCDKYGGTVTDKTIGLCNLIKTRKIESSFIFNAKEDISDGLWKRLKKCCEQFNYVL